MPSRASGATLISIRRRVALLVAAFAFFGCGGRESAPSEVVDDAQAPADDGASTRDASVGDDDAVEADAAYCTEVGVPLGPTLPLPCAAPLSESASFGDPPITEWCIGANGLGYETSSCECGGMLVVFMGVGTDCFREFLFDATTRRLVARLDGCNAHLGACAEGPSELALPESSCFEGASSIMHYVHHDWPADAGCP